MPDPLDLAAMRARGAAIRAAESLEDYARVLVADAADVQPENLSAGDLTGMGNLLSEYLALLARVEALEGKLPPPYAKYVLVASELLAEMGEWSEPLLVKIDSDVEGQLTMLFQRAALGGTGI